jgi:methionyl aminopeptidase
MSGRHQRIILKSADDIKGMEKACRIAADTLSFVEKFVKPGISTIELDTIAGDFIKSKGGHAAFRDVQNQHGFFPGNLCISVEEEVVHGLPSTRTLIEGQIVSLDCGVLLNGYFADTAITVPVGKISDEKAKLLKVANESLYLGIEQAVVGKKVFDISRAIQTHCEKNGFSLTRELVGHGVGKSLHEAPAVPNFVPALLHRNNYDNVKLQHGMSLAIEPMVHLGKKEIFEKKDGWTIVTSDSSPAAHFEHTVVILDSGPLILTERN